MHPGLLPTQSFLISVAGAPSAFPFSSTDCYGNILCCPTCSCSCRACLPSSMSSCPVFSARSRNVNTSLFFLPTFFSFFFHPQSAGYLRSALLLPFYAPLLTLDIFYFSPLLLVSSPSPRGSFFDMAPSFMKPSLAR
jgi:hypothetical protein